MINWIHYTDMLALEHGVKEHPHDFVYLNIHKIILFKKDILTTHFALRSEYEAILPKGDKK